MIDGLRSYPEMRQSGLRWLGEIPTHWDVRRNGRLFGARRETGFPDLPVLEVSIRSGVRVRDFDAGGRKQEISDRSKYQRAVRGDIAYNMMRMWQGAVGIAPVDGLVSPAYVVARPFPEIDGAYYAYLFRTAAYTREIDTFSRGIVPDRNRLYWQSFKQMPSAYPPLDEQRLIVRFLDWHGAQTAKLIRAKKRTIALLTEEKQAIIHRAVTRGLDPNAQVKPSGVEWLGEIPEHWKVKKLHQVTDPDRPIMYGIVLPGPNVNDGVFIVKGGNCEPGKLRPERLSRTSFEIEARYARSRLVGGDIVIAIRGGVGSAEIVPPELAGANLTQDAARIAAAEGVDRQWLLQAVRAPVFQEHVTSRILGATVKGINIRDLKRIKLAVPRAEEQVRIADFIAAETANVSITIDRAVAEISLLREYRTRLIADVVTGKLDVRGAAAALPEATDSEPVDEPAEDDDFDEAAEAEEEEVAA